MPQTKILIDSNVYFRLANSIHPLLQAEFGKEKYCLYVIEEFQEEYEKNTRLKSKFSWVNDPEYKSNRKCKLNLSKKNKQEVMQVFDFIKNHARYSYPGLSRVDITSLAHAYALSIPIVTDDSDMLELAAEFSIQTLKTLELLKLMMDRRHIDITIVRQIASYWNYADDKPKSFSDDYKKIFNETPPR
jgi:predicted nuclease of predicted toxin-antitoxin system